MKWAFKTTHKLSAASKELLMNHWSVSRWDLKIKSVILKALSDEILGTIFLLRF